jgi:arsenite methyltransferase
MSKQNEIREKVSKDYAAAVTRPTGGQACCGGDANVGAVASCAGYTGDELAQLPDDAVVNAFGCGNPLAFSEVREGEVVLDLGSGAGIDLLIAAKKVGPTGRVIGVDMTDEMIAAAEANIRKAGADNVEVRKGIIEALPLEDASVDWVISNCVINLSPEKEKVFAEIARVLKPGGRMQVSDIVAEELPEAVRRSAELYSSCIGGAISEKDYLAGLREAGLEQVEVLDRLVYKSKQLEDLAGDAPAEVTGCCGGTDLRDLAASVEGKVWSAEFSARKPSA